MINTVETKFEDRVLRKSKAYFTTVFSTFSTEKVGQITDDLYRCVTLDELCDAVSDFIKQCEVPELEAMALVASKVVSAVFKHNDILMPDINDAVETLFSLLLVNSFFASYASEKVVRQHYISRTYINGWRSSKTSTIESFGVVNGQLLGDRVTDLQWIHRGPDKEPKPRYVSPLESFFSLLEAEYASNVGLAAGKKPLLWQQAWSVLYARTAILRLRTRKNKFEFTTVAQLAKKMDRFTKLTHFKFVKIDNFFPMMVTRPRPFVTAEGVTTLVTPMRADVALVQSDAPLTKQAALKLAVRYSVCQFIRVAQGRALLYGLPKERAVQVKKFIK